MAKALGWTTNLVVTTREPRGSGYPTCYKIDVGNEALKMAIEVDGSSHDCLARRAQDEKKTAWLKARGWRVMRFKNARVDDDLMGCLADVIEELTKQITPA